MESVYTMQVKSVYKDDRRRFKISSKLFSDLIAKLHNIYPVLGNPKIFYADEDEDWIRISSDEEFAMALSEAKGLLRIKVEDGPTEYSSEPDRFEIPVEDLSSGRTAYGGEGAEPSNVPDGNSGEFYPPFFPPFHQGAEEGQRRGRGGHRGRGRGGRRGHHRHPNQCGWQKWNEWLQNCASNVPYMGEEDSSWIGDACANFMNTLKENVANQFVGQSSKFVSHVDLEEGSPIGAGDVFTKIWRVKNDGTVAWHPGLRLVWVRGDLLQSDGLSDIPVTVAGPNEEVDIALSLRAPEKPGRYISYWQMCSPFGVKFGDELLVDIIVPEVEQMEAEGGDGQEKMYEDLDEL